MSEAETPLEARLGHRFRDRQLLRRALTHASTRQAHNERLEFLGDAVLNLVVAEMLFLEEEEATEGVLTEHKARLVSRATVEDVAERLGIEDALRVGGGLAQRASMPRSLRGNALEALLGAIWLDAGEGEAMATCRRCVADWFAPELAIIGGPAISSPKHELQNLAQARELPLPRYHLTDEFQHPETRAFRVEVELGERRFPGAWGSSKKEAERRAAAEALRMLHSERRGAAARARRGEA